MITEQYILMCKGAKELQEAWEPKEGDLCVDNKGVTGIIAQIHKHLCRFTTWLQTGKWYRIMDIFWVPRQEDLQEIISKDYGYTDAGTLNQFIKWCKKQSFALDYLSMNQMWILFCMEHCFDKQWNGKTWESIKTEVMASDKQ